MAEHTTERLTLDGWTFWRVHTGCIRVQRGDFTAYLQQEEAECLARFIIDTDPAYEQIAVVREARES